MPLRVVIFLLLIFVLLGFSSVTSAAKTYITKQDIAILLEPNGEEEMTWPIDTTFTGTELDEYWIEISGVVSEGMWQPLELHRYVAISDALMLKPNKQRGSKTVIYKALKGGNNKAKTYRVIGDTIAYLNKPDINPNRDHETWIDSKEFTSAYEDAEFIKATGNISDAGWQPFDKPRWIRKPAKLLDITLPNSFVRADNSLRVAVIDKSTFHLVLYEISENKVERVMKSPVALGYDRCLPAEKGGQCYYTPEGEFEVDFKLFDPSGIQWCVPPKMRGEFKEKLARGENCWRGIMGRHALHFGDSLFLHGTSNPSSIGSRTTHGCVRLRNSDIDVIYRLMDKGDKVIVTADPESVDFSKLTQKS